MNRTLLAAVCWMVAFALPAAAQDIRGRVVEERSRQAVRDVAVSLLDAEGGVRAEATTDETGFFRLRAPEIGTTYTLVVVQPGYAEQRVEVRTQEGETLIPAVVLKTQAVELDPLEVEARARREATAPAAGFQRSSQIVAGANLARLERQGGTLLTAAREMSGLRTREWTDRDGRQRLCIESVRAAASGLQMGGTTMGGNPSASDACQWPVFVMDGIAVGGDPERVFRDVRFINDYESVEYLPPAEAGRLYGMDAASTGALVLWSRGRGPHVSDERNR